MDFFLCRFFKIECDNIINSSNELEEDIIYYRIMCRNKDICINVSKNNNYVDITKMLSYMSKILEISNTLNYLYINFKYNNCIDDITCINNGIITIIAVVIENKKYYGIHLLKQISKLHIIRDVFSDIGVINMKSVKKLQKYRIKHYFSICNGSYLFSF